MPLYATRDYQAPLLQRAPLNSLNRSESIHPPPGLHRSNSFSIHDDYPATPKDRSTSKGFIPPKPRKTSRLSKHQEFFEMETKYLDDLADLKSNLDNLMFAQMAVMDKVTEMRRLGVGLDVGFRELYNAMIEQVQKEDEWKALDEAIKADIESGNA